MQRTTRRGFAAALIVPGLAACADSVAPPQRRAMPSPVFDVIGATTVCKPCPPGSICAAVCEPISGEILAPERQ